MDFASGKRKKEVNKLLARQLHFFWRLSPAFPIGKCVATQPLPGAQTPKARLIAHLMPAQPRQHSPTTACEHRIAPGLEGKLPPLPCWHRPGTGGTGQERGAAGLHFPPPKCHFPAGRSKTPSHTLNAPPNTQHSLPKTAFPTAKEDLALQSLQHIGFYSSFILFYLFFCSPTASARQHSRRYSRFSRSRGRRMDPAAPPRCCPRQMRPLPRKLPPGLGAEGCQEGLGHEISPRAPSSPITA